MRHIGTLSDRPTAIERLRETKRRGAEWLLDRVDPDGKVSPRNEGFRFYRLPWTLTVSGHTQAATAVCGWIREHMVTSDGDFDRGHRKLYDAYAYRNATLVYGAHMARQFDLSSRGLNFILAMQDPSSGGFANDRDPDGTLGDVMDLPYTCGCGLACIALGRLDAARQVYQFLQRVWNAQTELPKRLYYSFSRRQQAVITEYDRQDIFWHVVESQEPRAQRWTVGGLSAAFLCRLYMVDPNPAYLALARDFLRSVRTLTMRYTPTTSARWFIATSRRTRMTDRSANSLVFSSMLSSPLNEKMRSPGYIGRNHSQVPPETKTWTPRNRPLLAARTSSGRRSPSNGVLMKPAIVPWAICEPQRVFGP